MTGQISDRGTGLRTERSNGTPVALETASAAGIAGQFPPDVAPVNPLGVLALGGKATDVLLQVCALRAARYGDFMDVMVPVAMDTEVASLQRLPAGLQIRLGEETSAPGLASLLSSSLLQFIAERVRPHLLVKSGRQTALGSNQVPAAALGLALYEHQKVYSAIEGFVCRIRDLPHTSRHSAVRGRGLVVVMGTDNGAVGRGLGRHVTRLVRTAMRRSGADLTLIHIALWGSSFEGGVPDPKGAAAAEIGGAVETVLDATGQLPLPVETDLDQREDGPAADFNIVLSGVAFQGDEGLWKAHAARVVDLLATSAGLKLAAIWRNQ